jgi:hypothetical protein
VRTRADYRQPCFLGEEEDLGVTVAVGPKGSKVSRIFDERFRNASFRGSSQCCLSTCDVNSFASTGALRVLLAHTARFGPSDATPNAVQWLRTAPPSTLHNTTQTSSCAIVFQCGGSSAAAGRRGRHTPPSRGRLERAPVLPRRLIVLVRLRATSDRYSTDLTVADLLVARGRRDACPEKESQTHWNLTHHLRAHHSWPYYRSNLRPSPRTKNPTSGPMPGIVFRRARLTRRRRRARIAPKSGSTWAQSFSQRREAQRSCISSGIVIIHGRFARALSSFRRVRHFNVGMAVSEDVHRSMDGASPPAPFELYKHLSGRGCLGPLKCFSPPASPLDVPTRAMCESIHDRPSITRVAPRRSTAPACTRFPRRSRGDAETRQPKKRRNTHRAHHQGEFATLHCH